MTLKRMDNVLIVVDDLEAVKAFFIELGLRLEGESTVEGPLVGSLIGLKDVRATLAMMRNPGPWRNLPRLPMPARHSNSSPLSGTRPACGIVPLSLDPANYEGTQHAYHVNSRDSMPGRLVGP